MAEPRIVLRVSKFGPRTERALERLQTARRKETGNMSLEAVGGQLLSSILSSNVRAAILSALAAHGRPGDLGGAGLGNSI